MIKKILNKFNKNNTNSTRSTFEHVGRCPKCGKQILEAGDVWTCEGVLSKTCNLSISRFTQDGKEITMDMINFYYYLHQNADMEKFIRSAFEDGTSSTEINNSEQPQTNNSTNTIVEQEKPCTQTEQPVVNNQQQETTKKQYANQNKSHKSQEDKRAEFFNNGRKLASKCSCGGNVYRLGNWAACSKCTFKIRTTYAEINFSDTEMSQLINKRLSYYKTFKQVCSNGKALKGRVYINFNEDGSLIPEYKFVNHTNNITGYHREQLFIPGKDGDTPLSKIAINKDNKTTVANNSTSNNNSNVDSNNNSGDGTIQKFDPLKDMPKGNSASNDDEYSSYLAMNADSEPF